MLQTFRAMVCEENHIIGCGGYGGGAVKKQRRQSSPTPSASSDPHFWQVPSEVTVPVTFYSADKSIDYTNWLTPDVAGYDTLARFTSSLQQSACSLRSRAYSTHRHAWHNCCPGNSYDFDHIPHTGSGHPTYHSTAHSELAVVPRAVAAGRARTASRSQAERTGTPETAPVCMSRNTGARSGAGAGWLQLIGGNRYASWHVLGKCYWHSGGAIYLVARKPQCPVTEFEVGWESAFREDVDGWGG